MATPYPPHTRAVLDRIRLLHPDGAMQAWISVVTTGEPDPSVEVVISRGATAEEIAYVETIDTGDLPRAAIQANNTLFQAMDEGYAALDEDAHRSFSAARLALAMNLTQPIGAPDGLRPCTRAPRATSLAETLFA